MIFQHTPENPEDTYRNATMLTDDIRENARIIHAHITDNQVNSRLSEAIKNNVMIVNIHRQSAMSWQLVGKMIQCRLHFKSIAEFEQNIETLTMEYQEYRRNRVNEHVCGCGAVHSEENPVTYDPIFKTYFCLDCSTAYELDE